MKSQLHKAVFAITSQGHDFYSAMTRVAVASLRVSNPGLRIVLTCDRDSDHAMRKTSEPLLDEVDEWLAIDTPDGGAGFRNRYFKTQLRSIINGPFLFLDSDIFVREDLSEIFALDCDIAGARNHSRETFSEQIWDQDRETLASMGWEIGDRVYLNGGVLFYNNTEGAMKFAKKWHELWSQSASGRAYYRDQPALNAAINFVRPKLNVLPDRYNAQISAEIKVAADAAIWHFYSSLDQVAITGFDVLVKKVHQGAQIDYGMIKKMVRRNHPWRGDNLIDYWAAKGVTKHGFLDRWEGAWLRREMRQYLNDSFQDAFNKFN